MRAIWPPVCALVAAGCGRLGFADDRVVDAARDAPRDARADAAPDAPDAAADAAPDAPPPTPPVFVQHEAGFSSSATAAGAFDSPVAAGDLVVAAFDYDQSSANAATSVSDSLGTAFALAGPCDGNGNREYIAYGIAPGGGSDTVTVTLQTAVPNFFELRLNEFANVSPTQPLDGAAGSAGTSNAPDGARTPPIITTSPNDLLFGLIIDGTVTGGSGFTTLANDFGDLTEVMVAPTPGMYVATGTATGEWTACAVAFRGR